MDNSTKESLKIVVVGHVDHGKSTVIGRLLYDTKSVPEGKIERVKAICREKGKPFEYAYLLDAFEEEQKQGITIDITQLQFFTEKRDYVIIDAPGHKEFLKNMISGAANAEAALLIVDALEGVQEQSKRHGYILSLLGIEKVYVIVNKMDLIDYSQEKFEQIKSEMNNFLGELNVHPLEYIPISAFYGENLTAKSDKMPWFTGVPVLSAIDLIEKDKGLENKPLRFPIQDVYKFDSRRIIVGRIESGTLHAGDEILITPSNKTTKVKTIEYWQEKDKTETISAGMSVGITVEDEFFNKRGEFISHKENPPLVADAFRANLFWMGKNPLKKGNQYKLKLATQEAECEIHSITKAIDATTLVASDHAEQVNMNDVAEVIIKVKEKINFDEFSKDQTTGRFVLVDGYNVSGGGIIKGIEENINTVCRLSSEEAGFLISCFDEFYYLTDENSVRRFPHKTKQFAVKDYLPLSGNTYRYPQDLDLIDTASSLIAVIRNSVLQDIVHLEKYQFSALPVINTAGLAVNINSNDDFQTFIKELNDKKPNVNRYEFNRYREIKLYNPENY